MSSHSIWDQHFFYNLLVEEYLDLFDISNLLLFNHLFYQYARLLLRRNNCQYWDHKPQQSLYDEMKLWEEQQDIVVPKEIRFFYCSWNQDSHHIYQKVNYVRTWVIAGRIRELEYYHKPSLLTRHTSDSEFFVIYSLAACEFSTTDYLCIACSPLKGVHVEWSHAALTFVDFEDVSLLTFIDLKGKKTGQINAIFDLEYVDHEDDVDDDPVQRVLNQIEGEEIGQYVLQSHGYSSFGLGMTARCFFELLTMIPENRFYHHEEASNESVCWHQGSGKKSFLAKE